MNSSNGPVNCVSNGYLSWDCSVPALHNPYKLNPSFTEEENKNQGHKGTSLRPSCWLGSEMSLEPKLLDFWFCLFPLLKFYTLCCSQTTWDTLRKFWNFNAAKVTIMGFLQNHKFYKYRKWRFGPGSKEKSISYLPIGSSPWPRCLELFEKLPFFP